MTTARFYDVLHELDALAAEFEFGVPPGSPRELRLNCRTMADWIYYNVPR